MIVTFSDGATSDERRAVHEALAAKGVTTHVRGDVFVLDRSLAEDNAIEIAALPGVTGVVPNATEVLILREATFDWLIGATALLGLLVVAAANAPAPLGTPADPLRMPETLQPSWPMLPLHGALSGLPAWMPAPVIILVSVLVLVLWPLLARQFAERRPLVHTLFGLVVLVGALGFAVLELTR